MNPLHTHDCDTCIYLGNDGENDYYFHRGTSKEFFDTTLICRYSSEPNDYGSGKAFCTVSPAINKALELAYTQGILNENEITNFKAIQEGSFQRIKDDDMYRKNLEKLWEGKERFLLP